MKIYIAHATERKTGNIACILGVYTDARIASKSRMNYEEYLHLNQGKAGLRADISEDVIQTEVWYDGFEDVLNLT